MLRDGKPIDRATLTAGGGWAHEFADLPVSGSDGKAYDYAVCEVEVPGYTSKISGNAKDGFTITNAKVKSPDPTDPEYPEIPENPETPEDTEGPTDPNPAPGPGGSGDNQDGAVQNTGSAPEGLPSTGDLGFSVVLLMVFMAFGACLIALGSRRRN